MAPLVLCGGAGATSEMHLKIRLGTAEVGGAWHTTLATAMVWRMVVKVLRAKWSGPTFLEDLSIFLSSLRDHSPSMTRHILNTMQADGVLVDWNAPDEAGLGVLFSDEYMVTPLGLAVVAGLGDLDMLEAGEEPEDYTTDPRHTLILQLICLLKEHGADDAAMVLTMSSHGDWEPYAASDYIRDMVPSHVWIAVALAAVTG